MDPANEPNHPAPPAPGGMPCRHASDAVVHQLAVAILKKEMLPGSALPTEAELSRRFKLSRLIIREAIHRLRRYELVCVHQGRQTTVLDPDAAAEIGLLCLEVNLASLLPAGIAAVKERQIMAGCGLLELAEQRMSDAEIDALAVLVIGFPDADEADVRQLDRTFWTRIATHAQNRFLLREMTWYLGVVDRDRRFQMWTGTLAERRALYSSLLVTLRARSGAAARYLLLVRDTLAGVVSQESCA